MIILDNDAPVKEIQPGCFVKEYHFPLQSLSVAIGSLDGRLPLRGTLMNEQVDELYLVMRGEAEIHIEGVGTYQVRARDSVGIERGRKFWVAANKLEAIFPTAPRWYPEQHKHFPEDVLW